MAERKQTDTPKNKPNKSVQKLERKVFDFFTLSQLGKSLISIGDLDNLAHVFLSAVYETSGASNCALLLYDVDGDNFVFKKSIGLDEKKVKNVKFDKEEGLFWQVLNSGEPFTIRDSAGVYRFKAMVEKWRLDKLDSEVWVPLIVKDLLRGVLTLGAKKDGSPYTDAELKFIQQLAAQAAVAIDSAILDLQKAKAGIALSKKMENLSILYDVSKALNFANDLKKTLLMILDKCRAAAKSQKASIMLLNKDTNELEVKVVRGIDPITERKINDGEIECTKIKVGEGIAGRVAKNKKLMIVDEVKKSKEFKKSDQSNVDNIICLPLVADDEVVGVLNITNKLSGEKFNEEDAEMLSTLAGQVGMTIRNANLYHLAITDGLTQLFIHRYFEQKLHDEFLRAKRYKRPVSLIMSDIDHFKKFNDTYGHQQGDLVLITVAKLFRLNSRDVDIPCRYGGEEYAVILPETGPEEAVECAERLRKTVAEHDFPSLKGGTLKVNISLGVATFPLHAEDEEGLVKSADQALYFSKENGRNRVTLAKKGETKKKK